MQNPRYFLNFHVMCLCLYKQPLWVAAVLNAVIFGQSHEQCKLRSSSSVTPLLEHRIH